MDVSDDPRRCDAVASHVGIKGQRILSSSVQILFPISLDSLYWALLFLRHPEQSRTNRRLDGVPHFHGIIFVRHVYVLYILLHKNWMVSVTCNPNLLVDLRVPSVCCALARARVMGVLLHINRTYSFVLEDVSV